MPAPTREDPGRDAEIPANALVDPRLLEGDETPMIVATVITATPTTVRTACWLNFPLSDPAL